MAVILGALIRSGEQVLDEMLKKIILENQLWRWRKTRELYEVYSKHYLLLKNAAIKVAGSWSKDERQHGSQYPGSRVDGDIA